jgi:hypothetical protein
MTAFRSRLVLTATVLALTASGASAQPPTPTPAKALADENAVLLETVGLLAGLQLYQTYLNLGLLADASEEDVYEPAEAAQLLGSVVGPLEKVEKQLEKVAALKLTKEDAAAVTRMKKIAGQLRQQGKLLQTYWDTGLEDHLKKYEETRRASWKELSDLLDLEPKKPTGPIIIEPKKPTTPPGTQPNKSTGPIIIEPKKP